MAISNELFCIDFSFTRGFCCFKSWIISLDDGRIEKKYPRIIKQSRFTGKKLKGVLDDDLRDLLDFTLENCGIVDDEDRKFVLKEIERVVKGEEKANDVWK